MIKMPSLFLRKKSDKPACAKQSEQVDSTVFQGTAKKRVGLARSRVTVLTAAFVAVYAIIGGRLIHYSLAKEDGTVARAAVPYTLARRPDIVDRNGAVMATDVRMMSLYANPSMITSPDDVLEALKPIFPELDVSRAYRLLKSKGEFVWLKRQITPKQQSQVLAAGVAGVGFRPEVHRFYPGGPEAAHILGLVDVDNRGLSGIERYMDKTDGISSLMGLGLTDSIEMKPFEISLDLRVESIMRDILVKGMEKFEALGATGIVLDANTGEIVALASVPDFDPNNPPRATDPRMLNHAITGVYEMGSTFKAFTLAMGLESGKFTLDSLVDAKTPLYFGSSRINDDHAQNRILTYPEVFTYSSNIGASRIAAAVGPDYQKNFLEDLGLLNRIETEIGGSGTPQKPAKWGGVFSATVSFGQGITTTPLQTAVAAAALINGGKLIPPTFLPRTEAQADQIAKHVVSEDTSNKMRYLLRLNGTDGSGRNGQVPGYRVGAKTGTSEKIIDGKYAYDHNFNAFLAAFPMDDPQYVVLVTIDDPKKVEGVPGRTAAWNAGPMAGEIIRRAAPILGVDPDFGEKGDGLLASY
ncbi:peptidoglycan D,D-transpeptidase FtsI family protein [Martelella mediterranea]|uniref:Cell division protein FtsI (Penicillin-binding protein 3) n=1 Tax=Martelella mediterranea TaxID=293089 RepID=A0A4R3NXD4_9HYPH|nr:penicillin-binding protein 2 [Martelella mediterranea]TCT43146.1 cell division protein FtsI (penicillin-binding protein 3) [Martelella mediterranea]